MHTLITFLGMTFADTLPSARSEKLQRYRVYQDARFRLTAETLAQSPCLMPEEDECYVLAGIRSHPPGCPYSLTASMPCGPWPHYILACQQQGSNNVCNLYLSSDFLHYLPVDTAALWFA
ncbi:hypothetical protein ABBQ38_008442 [Trebouxia sp. C0009 RCD-2024]